MDTWKDSCQEALGKRANTFKELLSGNTWNLIQNRRDIKQKINNTKNEDEKKVLQEEYTSMNKEIKKSARTDKRVFYDTLATEAEQAAGKRALCTRSPELSLPRSPTKTYQSKKIGHKVESQQIGNKDTW
ncbi:hypothetical protein DPMN_088846 [Dreissena polymorpha]|uniref:Uncharacterized protein n=1 Tax=Dreissena polymorpha TaxID=45954 RepID=A0A9D4KVT8_DREPO|nr:hypothetical protein DPMN_088846 [Dreissena polymorpha]